MTILDTFNNLILNDNYDNYNNSTSKLVKSAVVISSVAACIYGYYFYLTQSTAVNALQPAVTEDEAKKIMKSIMDKLATLEPKLTGALQNIKMQIMNSGQEVEDSIIMKQYILPHLNTQLMEIQTAVFAEYSVDEDEVEEAVNAYIKGGDDELITIQKKIRSLFRKFGGDVDDDDEEDEDGGHDNDTDDSGSNNNNNTIAKSKSRVMKPQRGQKKNKKVYDIAQLLELMNELTTQLLESTDDYCGCFIEKNGIPTNKEEFEQFQMGLMAISQGVEKNILDQEGMTELEFQSVLMKHQGNQRVQAIFLNMQMENTKLLIRHGINLEG